MVAKGDKTKSKGAKASGKADATKPPGTLRKAGKQALDLARQPVVSEVVATAMLAAAAALRDDGKSGGKAAKAGGGGGPAGVAREPGRFGEALKAMAIDLARRTLDSFEESAGRASTGRSGAPKSRASKGGSAKPKGGSAKPKVGSAKPKGGSAKPKGGRRG